VRVVCDNGADAPNPSPWSSPLAQGERRKGLSGVLMLGGIRRLIMLINRKALEAEQ